MTLLGKSLSSLTSSERSLSLHSAQYGTLHENVNCLISPQRSFAKCTLHHRELVTRLNQYQEEDGQEVPVLWQVLADDVNVGYQDIEYLEVLKVDGKVINSMAQLKQAFDDAKGDFVRIDLKGPKVLVMDLKGARAAHERIMAKYRVPCAMSRDLMG